MAQNNKINYLHKLNEKCKVINLEKFLEFKLFSTIVNFKVNDELDCKIEGMKKSIHDDEFILIEPYICNDLNLSYIVVWFVDNEGILQKFPIFNHNQSTISVEFEKLCEHIVKLYDFNHFMRKHSYGYTYKFLEVYDLYTPNKFLK